MASLRVRNELLETQNRELSQEFTSTRQILNDARVQSERGAAMARRELKEVKEQLKHTQLDLTSAQSGEERSYTQLMKTQEDLRSAKFEIEALKTDLRAATYRARTMEDKLKSVNRRTADAGGSSACTANTPSPGKGQPAPTPSRTAHAARTSSPPQILDLTPPPLPAHLL